MQNTATFSLHGWVKSTWLLKGFYSEHTRIDFSLRSCVSATIFSWVSSVISGKWTMFIFLRTFALSILAQIVFLAAYSFFRAVNAFCSRIFYGGSNRRITIVIICVCFRVTLWVDTDISDEPSRTLWNFGTLLRSYSVLFSEAPHCWHSRLEHFETYGFATSLLAWESILYESKYRLWYVLFLLSMKCVNCSAHWGGLILIRPLTSRTARRFQNKFGICSSENRYFR